MIENNNLAMRHEGAGGILIFILCQNMVNIPFFSEPPHNMVEQCFVGQHITKSTTLPRSGFAQSSQTYIWGKDNH